MMKIETTKTTPSATLAYNRHQSFYFMLLVVLIGISIILSIGWVISTTTRQTAPLQPVIKKPLTATAPSIAPNFDKQLQAGPYFCPSVSTVCRNAENLQPGALVASIPTNSPLYAAFDGDILSQDTGYATSGAHLDTAEMYTITTLTNSNRGLRAMYTYKGQPLEQKTVKEGGVIASASGQMISFLKTPFLFEIIRFQEKDGGARVTFTVNDFKQ